MAFHLRLKYKILILVLSVSISIYVATLSYVVYNDRDVLFQNAYELMKLSAENEANRIGAQLEKRMAMVQTLAESFSDYQGLENEQWEPLFLQMLRDVYSANQREVVSLWDCFELNSFLPGYTKPFGREYWQVYSTDSGRIEVSNQTLSLSGDPAIYRDFKKRNRPAIFEPYRDVITHMSHLQVLMTTIAAPIHVDGKFAGLVGCDLPLGGLQNAVRRVHPFSQSSAFILSNGGLIAAHPDDGMLARPIESLFGRQVKEELLRVSVKEGDTKTFIHTDSKGERHFVYLAPISIGKGVGPWSMGISTPYAVITATSDHSVSVALGVGIGGVLCLLLVLVFISNIISKPIVKITGSLLRLGQGEIDESLLLDLNTGDEIQSMGEALNSLVLGLQAKNLLAQNIGRGNLEEDITLLSRRDMLGQSLLTMRNTLRDAKQDAQIRGEEARRRDWVTKGLDAVGALLRKKSRDMVAMAEALIRQQVHYINANQGALFLRDEKKFLEGETEFYLQNAFAWDRKRYLDARYPLGIGLVGACAMERKPIVITDVPEDYSRIVAGVGDSLPRAVVLIPLLHEGVTIGVMEFASFQEVEPYVVEYLGQVAVLAAASIYFVRTAESNVLLLEKSRIQAEELAIKEAELQQNLEELLAIQEDNQRKNAEVEDLFRSLSASMLYVNYDLAGFVTGMSDSYLRRMGTTRQSMQNTYFADGLEIPGWNSAKYEEFWKSICAGEDQRIEVVHTVEGMASTFVEFYIPVKNALGEVQRVTKFSFEL